MSNSGPGYAKSPAHTVSVTPFEGRVVVKLGEQVLADTEHALELQEAEYPAVYYIPRSDTRMDRLVRTEHSSQCPFKGSASYFSLVGGAENAVWSYEHPYDEVLAIRDYLAFYPDRVSAIEVHPR
jgi:uncharacterized protein (DUF427 family)